MNDEALRRLWGASVQQRRRAQGMTQLELALAAGMSPGSLSKIENGAYGTTDRSRIALARALEIEVADLFPYPRILDAKAAS